MPSMTRRKRIVPMENTPSPKRGKIASEGLVSSPIKGPLQEHTHTNSPTFVAKSFYGIKKSSSSNPPQVNQRTPIKKVEQTWLNSTQSKSGHTQEDSMTSFHSRVEKLMNERIAASPVKQSLVKSCSKAEFRRVYEDEYKELENLVRRGSGRVTQRACKIVLSRSEDSDSEDCESEVTEGVALEFINNGLDTSDEESIVRDQQVRKLMPSKDVMKEITLDDDDDDDIESVIDSDPDDQVEKNKQTTPNHRKAFLSNGKVTPQHISGDSSTPSKQTSSGKKFFKTRTPVDKSKAYGVVCGKGFNLKVVPKTLQAQSEKKARKTLIKYGSPAGRQTRKSDSPKQQKQPEVNISDVHDSSADASGLSSPQSGFWFAPGFLSPDRNEGKDPVAPTKVNNDNLECRDGNLSLNKSNTSTYERTPPKKVTVALSSGKGNVEPQPVSSGEGSAHSSPSSVDLLEDGDVPQLGGSEDLLSSQSESQVEQQACSIFVETVGNGMNAGEKLAKSKEQVNKSIVKDSEVEQNKSTEGAKKLFPVFTRRSSRSSSSAQSKKAPKDKPVAASPRDPNNVQMILDAGQKKFGATQCSVCSMVYCHADPEDETAHSKFHSRLLEALKYPGWKKDRVLQQNLEDFGEIHLVLPDDAKPIRKKVEDVSQIMSQELGFPDAPSPFTNRQQKVFLYICEKEIAGCCVAQPIKEGFRIIPGDLDTTETSGQRPWRCSDVPEPACLGINRLWVAASRRRSGIATKLVDCVRQWFDYGTLAPLHKVAFSDPTPDGRRFAQRYMGSNTFLVYRYNSITH